MDDPGPTARAILSTVPFLPAVRQAARSRRVYLVGGAIRDAFLGRQCTDFDFLVEEAPSIAEAVAKRLRGKLIPLHEEHQTSRVVVKHGRARISLDFASPKGGSLNADLRARDFTINALAAGPLSGRARLFDPCSGRADLARRVVRMTSREALANDPLRVVRAYRFAATLGFRLDGKTRRGCREVADLLPSVHAERLGAEVLSALAGEHYPAALRALAEDGLLVALIPEFARTVGVEQGGVHDFDVAEHSLLAAVRLAEVMRRPSRFLPQHAARITAYLADERRRSGLVLATLLHDLGKPERRVWGGRRWRFFGHEERGAELAGKATLRLCLPKAVRRQVQDLVRSHMRLLPFMQTDDPSPRARRRFMRDLAPHGTGAVLLALADRRALRASPRSDDDPAVLRRLTLLLAAGEDDPKGRRHDLPIAGDDLLRLGLTPGPQFREILDAVEDQWLAGTIDGRADALAWVKCRYLPPRKG